MKYLLAALFVIWVAAAAVEVAKRNFCEMTAPEALSAEGKTFCDGLK